MSKLTPKTSIKDFENNYFQKKELVVFCRKNKLPTTGSKLDLNDRIKSFLSGEKILVTKAEKIKADTNPPSLSKKITEGYRNTELNREFFEKHIGKKFRFSVKFQKWMKDNIGMTYKDAIDAWYQIENEKKDNKSKTKIAKQFEYNQYTRDFFQNTNGYTRKDCIKCWKFKRDLPGSNKFEMSDLKALN